jgi:hypothetical protein
MLSNEMHVTKKYDVPRFIQNVFGKPHWNVNIQYSATAWVLAFQNKVNQRATDKAARW